MALINLKQISTLYYEALDNERLAIQQCYNTPEDPEFQYVPPKMPDALFVHLIKTHAQAELIYKNLEGLYQACTDFLSGNFQSYIDKHNLEYNGELTDPADRYEYDFDRSPFETLEVFFNEATFFALPNKIEQYTELLGLCQNFTKVRRLKREGQNPFHGDEPMWYRYINKDGEEDILPPHELPEDFVNEQVINDELLSVEVEYSLDHYNEFYFRARDYLTSYSYPECNLQLCASKILEMYKGYSRS